MRIIEYPLMFNYGLNNELYKKNNNISLYNKNIDIFLRQNNVPVFSHWSITHADGVEAFSIRENGIYIYNQLIYHKTVN